jgi:hypothetical protein
MAALEFVGWADTRTIPFPGEPDRVCDTVAELVLRADPHVRFLFVIEVQCAPHPEMLARVLEYLARLARELCSPRGGEAVWHVGAAVINLTGRPEAHGLAWAFPAGEPAEPEAMGLQLQVVLRNLSQLRARDVVEKIRQQELGLPLLVWAPLMQGRRDPDMMKEWVRLLAREPSAHERADFVALTRLWAELGNCAAQWEPILEGLDVKVSRFLNEMTEQARAEARGQALLEGDVGGRADELGRVVGQILYRRFNTAPDEFAADLGGIRDPERLRELEQHAWESPDLESFRRHLATGRSGAAANGHGRQG